MTATGNSLYLFWGTILGSVIKLCGIQLLYDKVFRTCYSSLHGDNSAGKIVTLAAKDLEAYDKFYLVCMLPLLPIFLSISGFLLWWKLGISGLVALSISVLFIPMQMTFSYIFTIIWDSFSRATDRRVNLISDIIEGIKVLKLYHWEKPYQEMNEHVRNHEINQIKKASYCRVSSYSMFLFGQALLLTITYFTFVSLGN